MKKRILGAIALAILVTGCNPNTSSSVPVTGNLTTVSPSSSEVSSEVSSSTVEESSTVVSNSSSSSTSQESTNSTTNKDNEGTVHSTGTGWLPPI